MQTNILASGPEQNNRCESGKMRGFASRPLLLILFGVALAALLASVLQVRKPAAPKEIAIKAILFTPEELDQTILRARQGNSDAAMDLFDYYTHISKDPAKAEEYLFAAAKFGNSRAVKILQQRGR
jgi:hypothetical protein